MAATQARTIRIADVVKALEIAAERLGDQERSCATLRAWAEAGRVTPAGQVLTPQAVAEGIRVWLSQKEKTSRKPATPQAKGAKRLKPEAAAAPPPATKAAPEPPAPAQAASAPSEPTKRRKKGQAAGTTASEAAVAAAASAALAASAQFSSYEEGKASRKQAEATLKELTQHRLGEVVDEIQGHMEEILGRTGPEALAEWKAAPASLSSEDRRELYMRLVHAVSDPDVRQPKKLNAELLAHQVEGLEWLASLWTNGLHGILADEMGLGKTIQTIALLLHLQERKGNSGPHLIVAPKSTLSNWEAEFGKFAPGFKLHVLTGDLDTRDAGGVAFRRDVKEGHPAALVTNYEQVYRNDWILKTKWQVVAVDEGHRLKNPETVLHNAMVKLKCRMRLLLTGTPLQNGLNELWALLHYLLPDLFTCMMDFKAWFSKPFSGVAGLNEFDIQLDAEQEQQVIAQMHSLLSPFLLQRLKAEALAGKLPPRAEVTVRVPLSAWQMSAYRDLEKRTLRLLSKDGDSVSSEQVNNALMQLRKISLHPYLFMEGYKSNADLYRTSGKVEALDRLLTKLLKFGHKVLIFSQFTSMLTILEDFLSWRGIESVRLDGQVPHEKRKERIDRFQSDPKLQVFLLSSRAGSLGLNLQAADTVVLFDLDWNPQNDKQAIARVHRVGQKREVRVVRLVTDTRVERHMEQRCKEKLDMEQKIMGAGMFRRQATAEQRREALRAVLGLGEEQAAAAEEGALTPHEELSRLLSRSEKEHAAFQAMDAADLAPKRGTGGEDVPPLVRCGRLMRPNEVPAGFSLSDRGSADA